MIKKITSFKINKLKFFLFYFAFIFATINGYSQCAYTGTPLTQIGTANTFCIDNTNTITTASVRSGQYVVVNVVRGFNYTFSVGNAFNAASTNENLTILDATTNANVSPATFASGVSGATISNWTASLSGQIKILLSRGACINDNTAGGAITLTLNSVGNTQDSQTAFGVDQWIGHVYNFTGTPPPGGASPASPSTTTPFTAANYVGNYSVPTETITEGFGGDLNCFSVQSNGVARVNILTDIFAVRYRMRSTKVGCYLLSIAGDDGIRVYVDGVLVFNSWIQQGTTTYCNNLVYLNGSSEIIFDYYEFQGGNVANFSLAPFVPSANSIAGPSIINRCSAVAPGTLDGSSYTYCAAGTNPSIGFQWQISTDNVIFTNIAGATAEDYAPPAIVTTTNAVRYYRRVLKAIASNAGSCEFNTNVITVNTSGVTPLLNNGAISGTTLQCPTTNNQIYSISPVTNALNYTWTVPTGWSITAGQGTISITVTTGTTGQNGSIGVTASNGCTTSTVNNLAVTVGTTSVAGTAASNQTICSGSSPTNLTLSGNNGTIQWQSSIDNSSFSNITGATSTTLSSSTIGNLTVTTYFRAVVTSGSCPSINSNTVTVTVNPTSVGGSVAGGTTICSGSTSGLLTLTGNTGTVVRWESSVSPFTVWTTIANTTSTYTSGVLTQTTQFRAVVQSGVCPQANSSATTVTVNPTSVGGSVAGGTTICSGSTSGVLTLTGNTGTVVRWESSVAPFTVWSTIANTTSTYTSGALTQTTQFRAVVQSGVCPEANSSATTVTVNPTSVGGSVAGGTTICSGSTSGVLTLSGNTGTVVRWESSVSPFTVWTTIANTNSTYTSGALTQTTQFRAVVQSGVCPEANSSATTVTVNPTSVGGSVSGGTTTCLGSSSGVLTLTGNTGTVVRWESSVSPFTVWSPIANTMSTYTSGAINQTTQFRAVVQSGVCPEATSSATTVSVESTTYTTALGWSNGTPTATKTAIISDNFTISTNFEACTLTVNNGAVVVVTTGNNVTLNGAITVSSGSFTLNNNANLLQLTDAVNSGNIRVRRNSSLIMRQDYTIWSSPVANQNLLAFSPNTLLTRFYTYNTSTNLYNAVPSPSTTSFNYGKGYLIRTPNNFPTTPTLWPGSFLGVPNNGANSVALTNIVAGQRFNAIGNPYPSPIDMNEFVADNSTNITGTLYFWRKTNSTVTAPGYATWTAGTFVTNNEAQVFDPNDVIRTGQGFIVEATATGSSVTFNNGQRIADNANQFFKTSANRAIIERNRIWLNVTNTAGAFSQMAVGYITGATQGVDAFDGRYFNDGAISLNSFLNNEDYVIQGRALPFLNSDVVPLNFKTTVSGSFTIAIDHVDGFFLGSQRIFLKDKTTNSVYDLKAGSYTFSSSIGTFNNRFEIVYLNAAQTDIQSAQCGSNLAAIDSYVYANLIAGAEGYRFRVTDLSANPAPVQTIDKALRVFQLTQLTNYKFNTQYRIEVAVKLNNVWQPFGNSCTITTPATTTQVRAIQCGSTLTAMSNIIYADNVPFASGYRFRVVNTLTSNTQVLDRTLREFRMNLLTSPEYNTLYTVEVAIRNTDGTYLPYGPICNITTPEFPTTFLQNSQCDYTAVSNSETFYAVSYTGATTYRFRFINTALSYSYTFDKALRTFNLSEVPGLQPATTYAVQVSIELNGEFGPYGKVCSLTTPGSVAITRTVEKVVPFNAVAYPNPYAESFNLNVTTSSDANITITVYDMIGKQIEVRQVSTSAINTIQIGDRYPSGVYNVIVTQGETSQNVRVIKR